MSETSHKEMLDYDFKNPTRGSLDGAGVLEELLNYVRQEPQHSYLVTVGTDSRQVQDRTSFVSVIAVQRVGHGGRYFWRRFYRPPFDALRRRIYVEASQSLELASQLNELLENRLENSSLTFNFDLQIHVDIGTGGPTADMINEIVGMIRGSGYEVRTKPEAYCAAIVADRYA